MCFKQDKAISIPNGKPRKYVDHSTYLVSKITSAEIADTGNCARSLKLTILTNGKYTKWNLS